MSLSRLSAVACALSTILIAAALPPASAASLKVRHHFTDTGDSTQSHYKLGANPYSELLQASDGNFYGTTVNGGSGNCLNSGDSNDVVGCGTVFRMTPAGTVTVLYSFPYDSATSTAPDGAYPTAGLIQGQDGYLYGVAEDGGLAGECNGQLGCGTIFRISTAGAFTRLHQFCVQSSCDEGGHPMAHLVQLPDTTLCGTTAQGGFENEGTVFCASTSGTLDTRYSFRYENGIDGYDPLGALLVGKDGKTLYGTTASRGAYNGGTVFSISGSTMTVLYAFDPQGASTPGACNGPESALIFGADGRLYGTTYSSATGGCIFSVNADGTGYASDYVFNYDSHGTNSPTTPIAGLVLARNGLMYGTTLFGSVEVGGGDDGVAYSYDPANGRYKGLADFTTDTGAAPRGALIEGADNYLYGTASLYGGSNNRGTDDGTIVRVAPALKK